ncbi:MFS transporter [Acidipropionibacterium jensenii]|uniref:MFS transporter n=1 Tax=Acidipropionibacterium jensenii TaxID=1749 RepID=UPI000BC346C9|nr:MFS transporter [Acidipropionibacterium jensenii]AZZ41299.1 MFS transporter [Acidipropionibacterium jensenii]
MKNFHHVLVNTLLANVTTSFLWFALTFWIYLETRSVLATGIVGGGYMAMVALCSLAFGVIVDHNRKKKVMVIAQVVTLGTYLLAGGMWVVLPDESFLSISSPAFWAFIGVILAGSVVENMRNIALSTTVTLLVPDDRRDRANGLVGVVQGIAFMVTSVFSGLSIGYLGMGPTLLIALVATGAAMAHLVTISIPEDRIMTAARSTPAESSPEGGQEVPGRTADSTGTPAGTTDSAEAPVEVPSPDGAPAPEPALTLRQRIDLSGSIAAIRSVPGLIALILFTCFNNLVGGVYMALMDPYGLELMSAQAWGLVLGVTSIGFIVGGGIIARTGLGHNPVRTLLMVNIGVAVVGAVFAIRESWVLFAVGIFVYMCMIPAAEAAEQTILQRVVPFERQGRVFGFAQSLETAAAPVSAFLVAPVAEFAVIPWMREGSGQHLLGWLLGRGDTRGIALMFLLAGLVMLISVALAFMSPQYRSLSTHYAGTRQTLPAAGGTA